MSAEKGIARKQGLKKENYRLSIINKSIEAVDFPKREGVLNVLKK